MHRLSARTAALLLGASALAGCSTFENDAASLTGPAAERIHKADSGLSDADQNLPTDLDGAIRRAQLLRMQGDLTGATRILSQLMLVAPDDARVVGEYGKVLTQEGRPRDAVDFLKRAVELQPNDWMLYSATGVAYDQLADPAAAKVAYEHALALKPGEASVLNNYAMSRMLAGDLTSARQLIAQAASTGSADPKIARNVALVESMSRARGLGPTSEVQPSVGVASASHAPRPMAQNVLPRPASSTVVMQDVPFDPLAGPTSRASHAPRKLTTAKTAHKKVAHNAPPKAKIKHVAKKVDAPPRLRMTADALRP